MLKKINKSVFFKDNLDALEQNLLTLYSKRKDIIFSFDVFDTLIFRKVSPEMVTKKVVEKADDFLKRHSLQSRMDVFEAREQAYKDLSRKNVLLGKDFDCLIYDWYKVWGSMILPSDDKLLSSFALEMENFEISLEIEVCCVNGGILKICRNLKNQGARLIFISDMYLRTDTVSHILDNCGYIDIFEYGITSGDAGFLKKTGNLFRHLAKEKNIVYQEWVHIGDNNIADYKKPKSLGILSFRLNSELVHQDYEFKQNLCLGSTSLWKGLGTLSYASHSNYELISDPEILARTVVGPVLVPFVHKLIKRLEEENIEKVFFFAREGMVLKQIYDKLSVLMKNPIPSSYMGISRLPVFYASMNGRVGPREIGVIQANGKNLSLENLLSPFKLPLSLSNILISKYGFSSLEDQIDPVSDARFYRLVNDIDFCQFISDKSVSAKEGLVRHLSEIGFFDYSRVAVVDVGWGGQIQEGLEISISSLDLMKKPDIYGFYFGSDFRAVKRRQAGQYIEALFSDEEAYEWLSGAAFDFVAAFELATRAPHGSVVGYETSGMPILSETQSSRILEAKDDAFLALLQQGTVDYTDDYLKALNFFNPELEDVFLASKIILSRFIRLPRKLEIDFFGKLTNASNLGSEETRNVDADYKNHMSFLKSLKTAMWKESVAVDRFGFAGAAFVSVIKGLRRSPISKTSENIIFEKCVSGKSSGTFTPLEEEWIRKTEDLRLTSLKEARSIYKIKPGSYCSLLSETDLLKLRMIYDILFCSRAVFLKAQIPLEGLSVKISYCNFLKFRKLKKALKRFLKI